MAPHTVKRLQQSNTEWNWSNVGLPWMANLSNGFNLEYDLLEALRWTWRADATDSQDKIFEILGLIRKSQATLLKPNYTISFIHCWIGICAHLLVHQDTDFSILQAASFSPLKGPHPPWLPDPRN